MRKETLLEMLTTGRAEWEVLLGNIDAAHLLEPGASGELSVKDLIAHIAWYEREMVNLLSQRALVGSDLWDLSPQERNAAILAASRGRTINDVRSEAQQVYKELVAAVQALSGDELNDPGKFVDMPGDWIPWKIIAENSYDHYLQHTPKVQAWLESRRAEDS